MLIALAQLAPVVGDFEGNCAQIKKAYQEAVNAGARILVTPELCVCGYPPHDLVERPEMLERNALALQDLASLTAGQKCALIVGHVAANATDKGRAASNCASVLEDGKVVLTQAKTLLPTYDVFDEARYFEPASAQRTWDCDGVRIGIAICEDLWADDLSPQGRRLYQKSPLEFFKTEKVDILLSLSASPYEWGKARRREALHKQIAKDLNASLVYVNQVGATDEILFDGGSFVADKQGRLLGRCAWFQSALALLDTEGAQAFRSLTGTTGDEIAEIEMLYQALVTGVREYFVRTGFSTAVIGLSGGIDSAVVAALAAKALGPQRVLGLAMPSQYSSAHSLEDAEALAKSLGIHYEVRPIKFAFSTLNREIADRRGVLSDIAQENLQSRLRGLTLMTLANHYNALVLTTGNKSELATGYCTLYGDMCGALAPLGDLMKTRVYDLAREINRSAALIPERSITKAPSAELKPNQTDQDTLPPYELLDELLYRYLEKNEPVAALVESLESKTQSLQSAHPNLKPGWVRDVLRRLEINEYKRRQAAPVIKISNKAFGIGRRIPIAKKWDQR